MELTGFVVASARCCGGSTGEDDEIRIGGTGVVATAAENAVDGVWADGVWGDEVWSSGCCHWTFDVAAGFAMA